MTTNDINESRYKEMLNLLKQIKAELEAEEHREEHEFLRRRIAAEKANEEMMQALKVRIMSTTIWACLSALVFALFYTLKHYLAGDI